MEKKYCPTHHLFYKTAECPLCMVERSSKYAKSIKVVKETKKSENKKEDKPITKADVLKLVEKFSKR